MSIEELIKRIRELPRINWYKGGMMKELEDYPNGKFRVADVEAILKEFENSSANELL